MTTRNKRASSQGSRLRPVAAANVVGPESQIEEVTSAPVPAKPEAILELIQQIQERRGAPLLTFVTVPEASVRGDVVDQVYEQLRLIGRVPQLDLFLHSPGGQTEVPWRLITLIRDFADRFCVLIPGMAHSAATHLAMGADQIVMGPRWRLSPVDPARSHPLLPSRADGEPPPPVSVQDLRRCVEFVKGEIGVGSPDAFAQVIVALFEKVHPLAIGAIQQSYDLARLISRKALSTHMDPETDKERIDRIVTAFADEFYSHGYWIGWREAKQIGLKVERADDDLWELMWSLHGQYRSYFELLSPGRSGREASRPIVWIDSTSQRRILEEVYVMPDIQRMQTAMPEKKMVQWLAMSWGPSESVSITE